MFVFDLLHTEAALLYSLFIIFAFENQRWFKRAIYKSELERGFVENTGLVAMICQCGFCLVYGWDTSFWSAVLLFACGIVAAQIYSLIAGIVAAGDHKIVWQLSTVAIYPVIFLFGGKLTWFGFFPNNGFSLY